MARVLIIDDSSDCRRLASRLLRARGHEATCVASAAEGLASLRASSFDMVLLDLEMPEMDGVECLARIRADRALAPMPVLIYTATPHREAIVKLGRLGVKGVLIKDDAITLNLVNRVEAALTTCVEAAATSAGRAVPAPSVSEPSAPGPVAPTAQDAPPAPSAITPETPAPLSPASTAPTQAPGARPDDVAWDGAIDVPVDDNLTTEHAMDLLKAMKPMIARSELLDAMLQESTALRALKPTAQQVLRLTDRPDASLQSVADCIKQDQALSLRILKLANSAIYGTGAPVSTVHKAVSRIGLGQIRSAVLSVEVLDAFGSIGLADILRPGWFWEHSIACGLLAARLARSTGCKPEDADAQFTAGLLHDIGRLLLAEQLPKLYPQVVAVAERLRLPLELVESRLLLMNHADLTDRVLRHWKFPPALIAPVSMHHLALSTLRQTAPRQIESVIPLLLANRLAHALLLGSSGNNVLYPLEDFAEHARLDPAAIREHCRAAIGEVADMRTNFLMHGDQDASSYLDAVRARLGDARPRALSLLPDVDPVHILLERLGVGADDPSMITLRICKSTDRERAVKRLKAVDAELGGPPLPVLVVGNARSCLLAPDALGARPVSQITLPIQIDRLVDALRALAASHRSLTPSAPLAQAA